MSDSDNHKRYQAGPGDSVTFSSKQREERNGDKAYFQRAESPSSIGQTVTSPVEFETYHKARQRGQGTFTLVAQDESAPEVIIEWVKANIRTAPRGKLFEALSRAIEFRDFPFHKKAD